VFFSYFIYFYIILIKDTCKVLSILWINILKIKIVNTEISLQHFIEKQFNTKEKIPFKTEILTFSKNENIIEPGSIEKRIYFLRSGIAQAHVYDNNGEEKIFSFFFPGQLFCSLSSFISQKPTTFTFTCISDCTLEAIPREPFYETLDHSILSNKIRAYYLELSYLSRIAKERDMLTKDATQRYNDLIKEHPEYIKQLPVNKIAKYLGIHPQSLSRLRK
jgi:CRP-like cAMP-binding protein